MPVDLNGDKAWQDADDDRLGFAAIAEAIAASIGHQSKVDGLVIGIEGQWGSGKSSLMNMMLAALKRVDAESRAEIIEFKPWLIGDSNGLLLALFAELAAAVDKIELTAGEPSEGLRRDLGTAGEQVRKFAVRLGGVGKAAKIAGVFVPGIGIMGQALESVAALAKDMENRPSLAAEKTRLRERLVLLPRRIVITIDDVDRLEPAEVVEIMRLVRSAADFPNVIYVLCYDPRIVAHSIEVAAQVDSGRAYIEKIVQVTVGVPQPEAFDLRRWFGIEIRNLPAVPDDAGASNSRLSGVLDFEGGRYLSTPRDVVRCLDSIRFFWGALQGRVDLADLVWLHLVKVGNPKLYDWIERYLPEAAAQASGLARVDDELRTASQRKLEAALTAEDVTLETMRHRLAEFLPGIDEGVGLSESGPAIFVSVPSEEIARAVQDCALSSPDHYRLFFAIEQPRNSPRQADFKDLADALSTSLEETCRLLARWNNELLSTGATKAETMLDRIAGNNGDTFDTPQIRMLLVALATVIDDLVVPRDGGFSDPQIWTEGRRLLRSLLPKIDEERQEILLKIFAGRSIDWLTRMFRNELFAHGRVDGRRIGEALLESEEFDHISACMLRRYQKLTFDSFKKLKRPLNALFAWHQAGDPDGPREMVSEIVVTDAGLVDALQLMTGRARSSNHDYLTLKNSTISYFIDYHSARSRIEKLSIESADPALRQQAKELAQSFKFGDEF